MADYISPTGILLNLYESVDILTLIKGGSYEDLSLTVGAALLKRPDVSFSECAVVGGSCV